MNEWEVLREWCPKLYKEGMIFECGLGWYGLLHDLSMKIEKILEKEAENSKLHEGEENEYVEMFAIQVKEKYGTLRFYMSAQTEEMEPLIHSAEVLSSQTCEFCGEPGKMHGTHWLKVRCDKCYEEKK